MSKPTRITLVRHGEVHNPDSIFYGRLPRFGLSAFGEAAAAAAGRELRFLKPVALYASPLLRARRTAEILAAQGLGLKPRLTSLLLEVHSPLDGISQRNLEAQDWSIYNGFGPGYEQPTDALERVLRFFEMARKRHAGRSVAAVTHGDLIAFAILWACGLPVAIESRPRLVECGVVDGYPTPASLTTFAFEPGAERPRLRYQPTRVPRPAAS